MKKALETVELALISNIQSPFIFHEAVSGNKLYSPLVDSVIDILYQAQCTFKPKTSFKLTPNRNMSCALHLPNIQTCFESLRSSLDSLNKGQRVWTAFDCKAWVCTDRNTIGSVRLKRLQVEYSFSKWWMGNARWGRPECRDTETHDLMSLIDSPPSRVQQRGLRKLGADIVPGGSSAAYVASVYPGLELQMYWILYFTGLYFTLLPYIWSCRL